jgi:poly(A) polymerase
MIVFNQSLTIFSAYHKYILSLLQSYGGESRLVGGCVRDALLNKINYDIDIATTLLPKQVASALSVDKNIKIIPTGIKFGTISVFIDKEKFEITTLRQDVNCNGRYANVEYTDDFSQDAMRRDFTINAISYCPLTETIYDYYNGIEDIKARKVIFIGDAELRIKEDYLRILRFFRFSSDYTNEIDVIGLQACSSLREGIIHLSKERIKSEMNKIISSDNAYKILNEMNNIGILPLIFPEIYNCGVLDKLVNFSKEINITLTRDAKYAALFYQQYHNNARSFKKILNDFRFSAQESGKICSLLDWATSRPINQSVNYLLKECWVDFEDYLFYISFGVASSLINSDDARSFIIDHKSLPCPVFPINGNDLLETGLAGKDLGTSLKKLKTLWISSDFTMTKTELILNLSNR